MPYPVTVHPFPSSTRYSCAYERGSPSSLNALIYLPGLTAGPHTFDLATLSSALSQLNYSLWEFRMRSSYSGFGFSSLANDAEDISSLVKYLRSLGKEKIVLMGHSTGCQDCVEYARVVKEKFPGLAVDGYVLLAPVSDREMGGMLMPEEVMKESVKKAKDLVEKGRGREVMTGDVVEGVFESPVTAYRWWSLAGEGGDDDFFSSDLSDERLKVTIGRVDKPVLFLPCEKDELVPASVDRQALLNRWIRACEPGLVNPLSGFVPGAGHVVSSPEAWEYIAERAGKFLEGLE